LISIRCATAIKWLHKLVPGRLGWNGSIVIYPFTPASNSLKKLRIIALVSSVWKASALSCNASCRLTRVECHSTANWQFALQTL